MLKTLEEEYSKILESKDFSFEYLQIIGEFIDKSNDEKNKEYTILIQEYLKRSLSKFKTNKEKCTCHYFISVTYSNLIDYQRKNAELSWKWDNDNIDQEIIHLRYAERLFDEKELEIERYFQILTNLGNLFNFIGRYVEALRYWNKVIKIDDTFGMAVANKGDSLIYHGFNSLSDGKEQRFFLQHGFKLLNRVDHLPVDNNVKSSCKERINFLVNNYSDALRTQFTFDDISSITKEIKEEELIWSIKNSLLLNRYLDIDNYSFAHSDTLEIPKDLGQGSLLFEQVISEFKFARNRYFVGSFDNSISRTLANENLKIAFRIAYSIFDKISYLINKIFSLDIANHQVTFRKVWFRKKEELNNKLVEKKSLALRGLFWISKELYYKNEDDFFNTIEPKAKEIAKIRNYIKHKCFLIDSPKSDNDFCFEISQNDFIEKTLRLLQLIRESILYVQIVAEKCN